MSPPPYGPPSPQQKPCLKPLSSEQLEPTYRKGSECWSEGTGRGSSRAFLGTLRLKFVLETEEKTGKLLWADRKGLLSPTHTSGGPRGLGHSPEISSPTRSWPFPSVQHPRSLPSPTTDTSRAQSTPGGDVLYKAGSHWGLFFQEALFIPLFRDHLSSVTSWRIGKTVQSSSEPRAPAVLEPWLHSFLLDSFHFTDN